MHSSIDQNQTLWNKNAKNVDALVALSFVENVHNTLKTKWTAFSIWSILISNLETTQQSV